MELLLVAIAINQYVYMTIPSRKNGLKIISIAGIAGKNCVRESDNA